MPGITTPQHEYLLDEDTERMDTVAQGALLGAVAAQPPTSSIVGGEAQSHIPQPSQASPQDTPSGAQESALGQTTAPSGIEPPTPSGSQPLAPSSSQPPAHCGGQSPGPGQSLVLAPEGSSSNTQGATAPAQKGSQDPQRQGYCGQGWTCPAEK